MIFIKFKDIPEDERPRERLVIYGSKNLSNEELLEAIEAFEDSLNVTSDVPTAEERIAAALEYQNLVNM